MKLRQSRSCIWTDPNTEINKHVQYMYANAIHWCAWKYQKTFKIVSAKSNWLSTLYTHGRAMSFFPPERSRSGKVQGERLIKQQTRFPLSREWILISTSYRHGTNQKVTGPIKLDANNKFIYSSLTVPSQWEAGSRD